MFDRLTDTIVAISSPPGISARGIVRMSGPESVAIAQAVFEPATTPSLPETPGHCRRDGWLHIDEQAKVPGEAYVFRAPASLTRQDQVELHTVGSPPVLAMIFERLVAGGARPAEPGEFTARAYFAGALDLTEVEGVAATIHAQNDSQLRAAQALLTGGLSRQSNALREALIDLLALLEAEIDFVEEPISFINGPAVIAILEKVMGDLEALLRDSPDMERLEALPRVLLLGPPNAGKSTLFNRLTGMDRAIASSLAGTTRDILTAPLCVPGGEVILMDSAGITSIEADPRAEGIATLSEDMTRRCAEAADLLLLVLDAGWADARARAWAARQPRQPALIVLNKIDALPPGHPPQHFFAGAVPVSALSGQGVDELREGIGEKLFGASATRGAALLALSSRQRSALNDALTALRRAAKMCQNRPDIDEFAELLALETREAVNALSLLTGQVATEDLLGRIFARFCVGK